MANLFYQATVNPFCQTMLLPRCAFRKLYYHFRMAELLPYSFLCILYKK